MANSRRFSVSSKSVCQLLSQVVGESLELRDILTYHSELVRGALFKDQETAVLTERQRERRCAVADESSNRPLLCASAGERFRFYPFPRDHDPDALEDTGASRTLRSAEGGRR